MTASDPLENYATFVGTNGEIELPNVDYVTYSSFFHEVRSTNMVKEKEITIDEVLKILNDV